MKNFFLRIAFLCFLLPSLEAWSACSNADLSGIWTSVFSGRLYLEYCQLITNTQGVLTGGNCFDVHAVSTRQVLSGNLNVDSSCLMTGTISLDGYTTINLTGGLSLGKDSSVGYYADTNNDRGTFSGVRR